MKLSMNTNELFSLLIFAIIAATAAGVQGWWTDQPWYDPEHAAEWWIDASWYTGEDLPAGFAGWDTYGLERETDLKEITYRLNGGNCEQSYTTIMDRNMFSCEDSSSGATIGSGTYYVEAAGSGSSLYFAGDVTVGSEFTAEGPFDSLGSATIKVYTSKDGDLLQTVTIKYDGCSNPLFMFDKFGASQVIEWIDTSGVVVNSNNGMSKENLETDVDADISTGGVEGGVEAMDTGSSAATTKTVTIVAAFVVVVASAVTLI